MARVSPCCFAATSPFQIALLSATDLHGKWCRTRSTCATPICSRSVFTALRAAASVQSEGEILVVMKMELRLVMPLAMTDFTAAPTSPWLR